jgi:alkylation response protein AidB-like acyl-CoA dehydrogenase
MTELTEASVRAEVRAWLEANWNPELGLIEWRNKLIDSGWGVPGWPKEWYGRDLPPGLVPVVEEEIQRSGAIGVAKAGIRTLAAATILAHGTKLHKEKFLRRILTGEDTWCQLFSEPGSGSDVAGAVTRAELSGNKWVVNGQKVWTTSAHHADYGLLLARTDWDKPKHKGLSYFIIDMHQPGVKAQPLKQMNGHASFNQVFLTDAEVMPEFLVANVGDGWAVTTTTLMHERRGADALRSWAVGSDRKGRAYDEERAEIATVMEPYKWYPQRAGRVDLILPRARETGRIDDPVVRQEIAKVLIMSKSAEWLARRARTAQELGRPQGRRRACTPRSAAPTRC